MSLISTLSLSLTTKRSDKNKTIVFILFTNTMRGGDCGWVNVCGRSVSLPKMFLRRRRFNLFAYKKKTDNFSN